MTAKEIYYRRWIKNIAATDSSTTIKRHIIHHAKQLNDPKTNAPHSWVASMYNLLAIYEEIHGVKSSVPIQIYKLLKKYKKNTSRYTPPPGGKIPSNIVIKEVEADSRKISQR